MTKPTETLLGLPIVIDKNLKTPKIEFGDLSYYRMSNPSYGISPEEQAAHRAILWLAAKHRRHLGCDLNIGGRAYYILDGIGKNKVQLSDWCLIDDLEAFKKWLISIGLESAE